jgi:hypothetical protein
MSILLELFSKSLQNNTSKKSTYYRGDFYMSKKLFKELQARMQHALKELDGSDEIPLEDLFPDEFIREHTKFSTVDDFLNRVNLSRTDYVENIPEDELDNMIDQNTDFNDWEQMKSIAEQEYVANKLKFE